LINCGHLRTKTDGQKGASEIELAMNIPARADLLEDLRAFLEVHLKSKVLNADPGQLSMYVKLVHAQAKKPKDKMIAYLLLRVQERLLEHAPDEKERIVCEFLIGELRAYYKELKR
jgi:hypothetical protein